MCGIAGWYRRGGAPVAEPVIASQCNRIIHRGPDDHGILVDRDFGFGMRRLSIIDIEGGHQPMETADRRYAIVFNGEIYNHLEVRSELGPAGSRSRRIATPKRSLPPMPHGATPPGRSCRACSPLRSGTVRRVR